MSSQITIIVGNLRLSCQDARHARGPAQNRIARGAIRQIVMQRDPLRNARTGGFAKRGDAVRVEELVNYFDYGYAPPKDRKNPFATYVALAPSPWGGRPATWRRACSERLPCCWCPLPRSPRVGGSSWPALSRS